MVLENSTVQCNIFSSLKIPHIVVFRIRCILFVLLAVSHFGPSDTLAPDTLAISFWPHGQFGTRKFGPNGQFGPEDTLDMRHFGPKATLAPRTL